MGFFNNVALMGIGGALECAGVDAKTFVNIKVANAQTKSKIEKLEEEEEDEVEVKKAKKKDSKPEEKKEEAKKEPEKKEETPDPAIKYNEVSMKRYDKAVRLMAQNRRNVMFGGKGMSPETEAELKNFIENFSLHMTREDIEEEEEREKKEAEKQERKEKIKDFFSFKENKDDEEEDEKELVEAARKIVEEYDAKMKKKAAKKETPVAAE